MSGYSPYLDHWGRVIQDCRGRQFWEEYRRYSDPKKGDQPILVSFAFDEAVALATARQLNTRPEVSSLTRAFDRVALTLGESE